MKHDFKSVKFYFCAFLFLGVSLMAYCQTGDSNLRNEIEKYNSDFKTYIGQNPCGWKTSDSLSQVYNQFIMGTLDNNGYPGNTLVGEETSEKFFQLMTLPFIKTTVQKKGLELMKPQILSKDVKGENFARMYDRISLAETGKQLYGTVVNLGCADCKADEKKFTIMPLSDPEHVDALRNSVGLQPMKEYMDKLKTVFVNTSSKNVIVQNPCNEKKSK